MNKSKTRLVQIGFYTQGYVQTVVEIPFKMTNQELEKKLNSGDFLTSINPGETLVEITKDAKIKDIGRIIELTHTETENDDFTVKNSDYETPL